MIIHLSLTCIKCNCPETLVRLNVNKTFSIKSYS